MFWVIFSSWNVFWVVSLRQVVTSCLHVHLLQCCISFPKWLDWLLNLDHDQHSYVKKTHHIALKACVTCMWQRVFKFLFNFLKLSVLMRRCCWQTVVRSSSFSWRSSYHRTRRNWVSRCRTCRTCWRPPGSVPSSGSYRPFGTRISWRIRHRRDPSPWKFVMNV